MILTGLIVILLLVVLLMVRRSAQISARAAQAYLQQGALIVDVRSNAEFQSGHLQHAIHIPLHEIDTLIARRVKDKNQVLLIHCQNGMRSQMAKKRLSGLGYTHAFSLGSYSRAARIVGER